MYLCVKTTDLVVFFLFVFYAYFVILITFIIGVVMSFLTEIKFHIENENHTFSDAFHQTIAKKFIKLFYQVYNIDIYSLPPDKPSSFVKVDNRTRKLLCYNFEFCGSRILVELTYSEYKLTVCFRFHLNKNNVMLFRGTNLIIIDVDEHLNLIKARICKNFKFKFDNVRLHAEFDIRIDINSKSIKKIYIEFLERKNVLSINDLNSCVPSLYIQDNGDFFNCYIQMFTTLSENPAVFYAVFDDYPIYSKSEEIKECFISIMEHFYNDYQENSEGLKAKLLLLDMQSI